MDSIEYKMLKLFPAEYIDLITSIFNSIFNIGIAPSEWSVYQIIFIDKKDRERVRLIALSSCFGKLMERIIAERFNWWAEHNDKFNQKQNGFRRGKFCAENLTELTTFVKTGFFNKRSTMAAFLDISSAYDNVFYRVLINKLINEKCPSKITQFISSGYTAEGSALL